MARQIIVLERINPGAQANEPLVYRYVFWLSVPTARQVFFANASATSLVSKGANAATAAEIALIQSGAIYEQVGQINVVAGSTLAQVEAQLQALFTAAQNVLTSSAGNQWDHYGSSWDGTSWTINTVA